MEGTAGGVDEGADTVPDRQLKLLPALILSCSDILFGLRLGNLLGDSFRICPFSNLTQRLEPASTSGGLVEVESPRIEEFFQGDSGIGGAEDLGVAVDKSLVI